MSKTNPKQKAIELIWDQLLQLNDAYWQEIIKNMNQLEMDKTQLEIHKELLKFEKRHKLGRYKV